MPVIYNVHPGYLIVKYRYQLGEFDLDSIEVIGYYKNSRQAFKAMIKLRNSRESADTRYMVADPFDDTDRNW